MKTRKNERAIRKFVEKKEKSGDEHKNYPNRSVSITRILDSDDENLVDLTLLLGDSRYRGVQDFITSKYKICTWKNVYFTKIDYVLSKYLNYHR